MKRYRLLLLAGVATPLVMAPPMIAASAQERSEAEDLNVVAQLDASTNVMMEA